MDRAGAARRAVPRRGLGVRSLALALAALLALATRASAQQLRLTGAPGGERIFTAAQLAQLSTDTLRLTPHHGTASTYRVVSLRLVLAAGGVVLDSLRGGDLTRLLLAEGRDGYRVAFTLGELAPGLGEREVLVAFARDGAPLPDAEGPFRLLLPTETRGARAVRQLQRLLLTEIP